MKKRMTVRLALAGLALSLFGSFGNAAPVIVGNYYDEFKIGTCLAASDCFLEFTDVPAGKIVVLTRIACSIRITGPIPLRMRLQVRLANNGVQRPQDLIFVLTDNDGLEKGYVVESSPNLLLGGGTNPSFRVNTDGTASSNTDCFISGTIF